MVCLIFYLLGKWELKDICLGGEFICFKWLDGIFFKFRLL